MAPHSKDVGCVRRLSWSMVVVTYVRDILWHMQGRNSGTSLLWSLAVNVLIRASFVESHPVALYVLMLGLVKERRKATE